MIPEGDRRASQFLQLVVADVPGDVLTKAIRPRRDVGLYLRRPSQLAKSVELIDESLNDDSIATRIVEIVPCILDRRPKVVSFGLNYPVAKRGVQGLPATRVGNGIFDFSVVEESSMKGAVSRLDRILDVPERVDPVFRDGASVKRIVIHGDDAVTHQ